MKKTILAIAIVILFIGTITLPAGADPAVNVQKTEMQAQTVVEDEPVYSKSYANIDFLDVFNLEIKGLKIGDLYLGATITGTTGGGYNGIRPVYLPKNRDHEFEEGESINIKCSLLLVRSLSNFHSVWSLYAKAINIRVFE